MQLNRRYGIYYLVISFFLCCMLAAVIFILYADYEWLVRNVVLSMQKKGLEEKIRRTIFPRQRFILLQRFAWLALVLTIVFFTMAIRYRQIILQRCRFVYLSVRQSFHAFLQVYRNNSRQQNISLFVLFIMVVLFYSHYLFTPYLTYDEMWSYNYYTANPFYYSFFTYSNYPLFELSTHLFKWCPFPMHVNLRLSPFLFGLASFFVLYACVRQYFSSHFIAMAAAASFAFMPMSVLYFATGRGVMHDLFFTITGLFSFLFWITDTSRRHWLVIYGLSGVLGLYSMTPHILFIILLSLLGMFFLLKKDKAAAWSFAKINMIVVTVFLILYTPILLTTGGTIYRDVINNAPSFFTIVRWGPSVLGYVAVNFVGSSFITLTLYALAIPVLMFVRKQLPSKFSVLTIISFCIPLSLIFFYLITRFIYAGRSLAFAAVSVPLFVCLFLQLAIKYFDKHRLLSNIAGIILVLTVIVADVIVYYPVWPPDKYTKNVSDILIDYGISNCYDNSKESSGFFYYYPAIEYHYRVEQKPFEFAVLAANSIRYKTLSATDQYDCIIYDINTNDNFRAPFYHEIYRDPQGKFKIWARNNLKK